MADGGGGSSTKLGAKLGKMSLALPTDADPAASDEDRTPIDVFTEPGSVYCLLEGGWSKLGHGLITLTSNPHNPKQLIFKLSPDGAEDMHVFQIKPKLKEKGPMSWVLKGLNAKEKTEQILAVRFQKTELSALFQSEVQKASKRTVSKAVLKRQLTEQLGIDELIEQAPKKVWTCEICTAENKPKSKKCDICQTPRPLHSIQRQDSGSLSGLEGLKLDEVAGYPPLSPRPADGSSVSPSGAFDFDFTGHHGTISSPTGSKPPSPTGSVMSETDSIAEFSYDSGLKEEPSVDDRIRSTESDFHRILSYIDSKLVDHSGGAKLYEDLRKVAKRLLKNEDKFRVLDRRNPVVRKRLLDIEGVEAYVKYLGFELNEDQTKMICPKGEPAKSIIKAAMNSCSEFGKRAKEYQMTIQRASRPAHMADMVRKATLEAQAAGLIGGGVAKSASGDADGADGDGDGVGVAGSTGDAASSDADGTGGAAGSHGSSDGEDEKDDHSHHTQEDTLTLKQMIRSITDKSSRDLKTQDVILLCHKAYAESIDLLKCLIERYKECENIGEWNSQLKVGNMLKSWLRDFYILDFEAHPECLDDLSEFIEYMESSGDARTLTLAKSITKTLEQKEQELDQIEYEKTHKPRVDLAAKMIDVRDFDFLRTDPRKLAEQISLKDFELFRLIKKRECLGQGWKKPDRETRSPNIMNFITHFNETSKWVQLLILEAESFKQRVKVLKHVLKVAGHLLEIRNYSSCCAFQSALSTNAIHRLKKCWAEISSKKAESYAEIKRVFNHSGGYATLRKIQTASPTPSILHIGLVLQDIVYIDEGTVDRTGGKINFSKLTRLFEAIERLTMYQLEPFPFKEDAVIQQSLEHEFALSRRFDDDTIYDMSTAVKNSDERKKK